MLGRGHQRRPEGIVQALPGGPVATNLTPWNRPVPANPFGTCYNGRESDRP